VSADRKPDPQLAGATEAFVHERASATPSRAQLEDLSVDRKNSTEETQPIRVSLRDVQEWFAASVTHPEGLRQGITAHTLLKRDDDLERLITASDRLSAFQRLSVYHHGYHARLVECLADDYPAVQWAMGEEAFEALCHAYVERHPSRSPSLNFFGRHMSAFLRTYDHAQRDFLAELATLEWALVEVLHAAPAPTLSLAALSAIPPEKWAFARLPRAQTVRLLRFAYPVNAFFQAWRRDERPTIPEPRASATAVYRQELTLWRLDLTPEMTRLLEALFADETLGDALARLETDESNEEQMAEVQRNVMSWFRTWVEGGVFARIDVEG